MTCALNAQIVQAAQKWIGTPYRHQSSLLGVGCDCLGLILGVWREIYGHAPVAPQTYARNWSLMAKSDQLLDAARTFCIPKSVDEAVSGNLLVFRWDEASVSRHLAIMASATTMIHAYERSAVVESAIVPSWRRRISGTFEFPPKN